MVGAGGGVEGGEERGREGEFAAVEADADDGGAGFRCVVAVWREEGRGAGGGEGSAGTGLLKAGEAVGDGEVAEEAQDQLDAEAEFVAGAIAGGGVAGEDGGEGDAAGGVGLRVEEDFGVDDTLGVGGGEVGPGEVGEVLRVEEDGEGGVVVGEEVVQGGEVSVASEEGGGRGESGVGGRGGERDGIAGREGEEEARREGAFEVNVVLAFG